MPSRASPFVDDEYYHVFNRGINKMVVFESAYNYKHFLKTINYYQYEGPKPRLSIYTPTTSKIPLEKKIVDIISYCLMPNHFHFLLRQNRENGITEFISNLTNSYTKYVNIKTKRCGPLFQGEFKAVHVENNDQLLHLSRYIHLNPVVSFMVKDLEFYSWSSYLEYIGIANQNICSKEIILDQFKTKEDYKQFCLSQIEYAKELERIKHLTIDE